MACQGGDSTVVVIVVVRGINWATSARSLISKGLTDTITGLCLDHGLFGLGYGPR